MDMKHTKIFSTVYINAEVQLVLATVELSFMPSAGRVVPQVLVSLFSSIYTIVEFKALRYANISTCTCNHMGVLGQKFKIAS